MGPNDSTSEKEITYDLGGFTNITGDSVPYRTSSDENLAQLSSIAVRAKVTSYVGKK